MGDKELTLLIAAVLAYQPRSKQFDNWEEIALHDALKLMDEFDYHSGLKEKECGWCYQKPNPK